jgi:phosphoglycerol transferase MdoB-like AlkP superfamily enzyme
VLNYNTEIEQEKLLIKVKNRFFEGIRDKDFRKHFILILLKSILLIVLLSDDKANGINYKTIFMSLPPLVVWIAINAAFVSIGLFFSGKMQKWMFWVLNFLFTLLVIGDIWYYRSNSVLLNFHMFSMTNNLENLGSSIISMVRVVDLLFITDLIIIGFKNIKDRKNISKNNRNVIGAMVILIVSLSYLLYVHIKVDKLEGGFEGQMVFKGSWNPNQMMANLTPIGYHIYDGYDFYKKNQLYVFEGEEKETVKATLTSINEDNEDNKYAGIMKGKNLLIIQWESLETCVINQSIDGQEITPNINKLLGNSLYFNNFYDQTYSGTSSDAELITNTSVFPVRDGSTFFRFPNNTYDNSLPNIFKEMGYSTLASHPDKGSYWNWLINLKNMGYDTCLEAGDYDTSDVINLGVSDESYLKQFREIIHKQETPFMAYTITLTSHSPFNIPKENRDIKLPDNLEGTKLGGYFQSINYTDKYIGELLKDLEEKGTLDNTVVAIYGDHEGVHKFYDDEVDSMNGLEPWMKKNNKKIPFIIYNKDLQGETLPVIGGQVDTLPTLAYLFGSPKDTSNIVIGRNLLNTKKSYALLSNHELIEDGLEEVEKEKIKNLISISDKMIRGNYYRNEGALDE